MADESSTATLIDDLGISGSRLVTLCGTTAAKFDAIRDSQDILEEGFARAGLIIEPVDLGSWSLPMVPGILREIASRRPDVILMQYPSWAFGRSFAPLAIAMSQLSAPLVVMLHEFVAAHPMRKLAVGALLARADLVGVTADRERDSLRAWYPWLRNRLRNIPIASNIPSRPWAPSLPPTATYFGQLRPGKGLEEFFDCHARTSQQMPHVAFRIVGSLVPQCASYGEAIRKRAQACGIKMLIGPGSAEVAEALSQATVALLPFPGGASFRRGSLFAAANCGVPIATLVGDDTPHDLLPFLDHARDVDTLTAVTIRYLSSQEDRYIAHARSMELAIRFGWDKTISRYLKVFAEAIRKKAGDGTRILHPDSKYFAFGPSNRQDLGRRESAGETNA